MADPISSPLGAAIAGLFAEAMLADDATLRRLAEAARNCFVRRGDTPTLIAFERVADTPDSPSCVDHLGGSIDEAATVDPRLRSELEKVVEEVRATGVEIGALAQSALGNQYVHVANIVASSVSVSYGSQRRDR